MALVNNISVLYMSHELDSGIEIIIISAQTDVWPHDLLMQAKRGVPYLVRPRRCRALLGGRWARDARVGEQRLISRDAPCHSSGFVILSRYCRYCAACAKCFQNIFRAEYILFVRASPARQYYGTLESSVSQLTPKTLTDKVLC